MKLNATFFASFVVGFFLFAGLGTFTYFLVDNASQIDNLKVEKIDSTNVFDRQAIDKMIPSTTGAIGPPGPKGDPATTELDITVNNLYPFDFFASFPVGTPLVINFSADFKDPRFVKTIFMGWIDRKIKDKRELIGEIFHQSEARKLGYYRLITTRLDGPGFTNRINWDFIELKSYELETEYLNKYQFDNQLFLKADKTSVYTKAEVDAKLTPKADLETTYSKGEVDAKLQAIVPPVDTYSETEIDNKLALKAEITDTYTRAEIDTKLNAKISKWRLYSQKYFDDEIAKKLYTGITYSKDKIKQLYSSRDFFYWVKYIKTAQVGAKTTTLILGDQFNKNEGFRQGELLLNWLELRKGDKLTVVGKIRNSYRDWQGLVFRFRNHNSPAASQSLLVNNIQFLSRWYEGTDKIKVNQASNTPTNVVTTNSNALNRVDNDFGDHFSFTITIFFMNNHIRVISHGFSSQLTTFNEDLAVAILKYPSWYNESTGNTILLSSLRMVPVHSSSGDMHSSYLDLMQVGTEITIIREHGNYPSALARRMKSIIYKNI